MTKRLLSLALIAVMMAMLFPVVNEAKADWTMYVYTDNGKSLNVRSDPMTGDNVIGSLAYGESVSVRMTLASGWTAISWAHADGYVAYVQSRFLIDYKPAPKPTSKPAPKPTSTSQKSTAFDAMNTEFRSARRVNPYTVVARPSRASGWVNLRWAPSTDTEVISQCPQGKELTVLAELKDWYQVEDPATGYIGFISSKYVSRK
ncbi:MAG: SH3 domain-containing protein [Clostridia bacterium]|nr:SH3 domain-containing protein [Clostridia bacterium]